MVQSGFCLSEDQKAQYLRDGFLILENFYTADQCQSLKQEIQRVIDQHKTEDKSSGTFSASDKEGDQNQDEYFMTSGDKIRLFYEQGQEGVEEVERALNKIGHALHTLNPTFRALSLDYQPTRDILRSLGFKAPVMCQSMYIFKRARVGGAVRPHVDGTFLHTDGRVVGIWVPLEPANRSNGCLWFVPGSHNDPITETYERTPQSGFTAMKVVGDLKKYPEESYVAAEMKAGDVALIHKQVVHKSEKNLSDKPRDAFTFHVFDSHNSGWSKLNWLQPTEGNPASFPLVYNDA